MHVDEKIVKKNLFRYEKQSEGKKVESQVLKEQNKIRNSRMFTERTCGECLGSERDKSLCFGTRNSSNSLTIK